MKLTPNAITILEKRYLKKENDRVVETPEDMFRRVAKAVAGAERLFRPTITAEELAIAEQQFFSLMTELDFMPNSPTLMNAGRDLGQLSACFVIPVGDSMEEIFNAVKDAALIHKSGGGTGFSFSRLRPKNSPVRTTGGVASGPVSFMKVFNAATEAIKQGGTRRGANMGILRVDHPDIKEFIQCKQNNTDLTNFNISVGLTREFMEALEGDDYYDLVFNGRVYERYRARQIFDIIVEHAWANGEPGIVFLDRLNESNPTPELGEIEATNPCGEQPLLGYEACNLGSVNLSHMVADNQINWDKLKDVVTWSTRFLDNVIEINRFPLPVIEAIARGNRKIGLGIMGWADMLFQLRIPYDSEQAVELARKVMGYIRDVSHAASQQLAEERGSFPNIEQSIFRGQKRRNATCTTIAPTGTISMIAGTTSGIEPIFSLAYTKNVLEGEKLLEVNPVFEEYVHASFDPATADKIFLEVAQTGSCRNIEAIPAPMRRVFTTALEIAPKWHIRMQAAFQEYTDNAVSKTVNFPFTATREDVQEVFLLAYNLGCKGVTVYRSGSREEEVLVRGQGDGKQDKGSKPRIRPRPRPKRTIGVTEQVKTGCGKMYITVNSDQEGIIETFITTGSTGGCQGFAEGVSRLVSLALRANLAPESIVDQLTSVSCPNFLRRRVRDPNLVGKSCPDIIGRILAQELERGNGYKLEQVFRDVLDHSCTIIEAEEKGGPIQMDDTESSDIPADAGDDELIRRGICPDCHARLHFSEGCMVCRCGFSRCE